MEAKTREWLLQTAISSLCHKFTTSHLWALSSGNYSVLSYDQRDSIIIHSIVKALHIRITGGPSSSDPRAAARGSDPGRCSLEFRTACRVPQRQSWGMEEPGWHWEFLLCCVDATTSTETPKKPHHKVAFQHPL